MIRASSARLATPRSRRASITRLRLPSLREANEPLLLLTARALVSHPRLFVNPLLKCLALLYVLCARLVNTHAVGGAGDGKLRVSRDRGRHRSRVRADAARCIRSAAQATQEESAMKMRAAVLEEFGEPLVVQELELTDPKEGEALVRLVACGVCHTDLYTASGVDPSGYAPTVLGHEGAGVVEAVGPGVDVARPSATTSSPCSRPQCGECVHCRRRAHQPLPGDPRAAEQGLPARRDHPPAARRRGDPPLHGHLDLRRVHGDAGDRAREGQPRGAARPRLPVRLRALDRARRGDQHRQGPRGLDLRRLRRRDGRPRRGRRLPAAGRRADRLRRPLRGSARARQGPGRDRDDDRRRGRGRARSSRRPTASAPTTPSRRPATSR